MNKLKEFKVDKLMVKVYETRVSMGLEAANETSILIKKLFSQKEELNMIYFKFHFSDDVKGA